MDSNIAWTAFKIALLLSTMGGIAAIVRAIQLQRRANKKCRQDANESIQGEVQ